MLPAGTPKHGQVATSWTQGPAQAHSTRVRYFWGLRPRIFDRALEPPQPSLPRHPPPLSNPPVAPRHPHPPPPYRPPDPCPTRTWAPRPPVTPAPRPPRASLASAPPAPPADATKRPPQEPRPRQPRVAPPRTRPCIVRIEALHQKVRIARRPRNPRRGSKDMPPLG
ncbi:PREDICTED: proline-rich protein 2-like [Vollenhovia emeryi]|uniref:proline-rich protein 2-like n=1 Tax=Vollenhovia emeryi TaxID=411798 RepID=UPI0005F44857|nr:PREDICTED: proline-rich protein 2-like [Vollenhovia emeryi]